MNHIYYKHIARIVVWILVLLFAISLYCVYARFLSHFFKIVIIVLIILVLLYIIGESIFIYKLITDPSKFLNKVHFKVDEHNESLNDNHSEKETIMDVNDKMESSLKVKETSLETGNIASAIRIVVQKWGVDYLKNRFLLNILNDYQVFKDIPAAKHILQNMQANGYIDKIIAISNWELESKNMVKQYVNEFGAKEEIVLYLVQCIGYGLNFISGVPQYCEKETISQKDNSQLIKNTPSYDDLQINEVSGPYDPKRDLKNYRYPTLDLLKIYDNGSKPYIDISEQTANKNRIVDVLRTFGLEISSIKAMIGPTITLYEIMLAPGVRISKVKNLEDDIALSLAALGIRVIAPIPGKGTIGIETPNAKPSIVSMESLLNSKKFQETTMDLPCAIGKTITNEVFMFDLAKAPHLLVAGSTGQGKSIGLNAILTSLIYKKHPAELKLVLIDTRQVEFTPYRPLVNHFLAKLPDAEPIVTDVLSAIRTINSLCKLMDTRCDLLKEVGARNIKEYNKKFIERRIPPRGGHAYMPYIVMAIDEYGDMMMASGKEFETPLLRIARLGRLVGIHMVIATRRPTTTIITDAIKMEFPARMAFRVLARIDSMTILDRYGAQQLVGRGDMLFVNGSEPERIQCAYIDTLEVERIIDYISSQQSYNMPFELPDPDSSDNDLSDNRVKDVDMAHLDPLFEDAARLIIFNQSGSTSLIQRKFAIGYNRANRLMDQLEKAGILGVARGSAPREVLIHDEYSLNKILASLR